MVTALADVADRVKGLKAGADDFLTKPINDTALMARVRSLLRFKMIMDEWRLREEHDPASSPPQRQGNSHPPKDDDGKDHCSSLLEDNPAPIKKFIIDKLKELDVMRCRRGHHRTSSAPGRRKGISDVVIASLNLKDEDGLPGLPANPFHTKQRGFSPFFLIGQRRRDSPASPRGLISAPTII